MQTVQVNGINYEAFEDEANIADLERIVMEFLSTVQDQADIASTKIVDTQKVETSEVDFFVRRKLTDSGAIARTRSHVQQDTSSVDITIAVTGEYQPPPELDLGIIFQDSFDNEGDAFVELLQTSENEQLQRITKVEPVKIPEPIIEVGEDDFVIPEFDMIQEPEEEPLETGLPTIPIVVALSGMCVALLFFVLLWSKKKEARLEREQGDPNASSRRASLYATLMHKLDKANKNTTQAMRRGSFFEDADQIGY